MAVKEIEESEFLASQQVVQAFQKMLANPKARELVLRAQKTVNPDAVIPEIDARVPVEAELAKMREELAADRAERAKAKEDAEAERRKQAFTDGWEKQKRSLIDSGYTDEGVKKIEEHAEKEGIPNLRAAAADWEKLNPPSTPAQPSGSLGYDIFNPPKTEEDDIKRLMESKGDNAMALDHMIAGALNDFRGAKR